MTQEVVFKAIRAGVEAGGPMRGLTWVWHARLSGMFYTSRAGVAGAWFLLTGVDTSLAMAYLHLSQNFFIQSRNHFFNSRLNARLYVYHFYHVYYTSKFKATVSKTITLSPQ